jgi:diaminohydroxyphosphoribosylaminopyrimidine deaminase/5-amino-6-(5-phosphoribosylamino)uracil reductase
VPFTSFDLEAMRRALELARRGVGRVEPNPPVGAVVAAAAGDRIVGEGWHERFGGPHAEVIALAAAGTAARGGTLYVTLEPCCHHGKTPPCTEAVIAAGVARVVIAAGDPFPQVDGGGITRLRAVGITVECGLLEEEACRLTAAFRKLVTTGRPWVIAKWAMSRDGRLAGPAGSNRWISSPQSRAMVHELRGRVDAIVVGSGTAVVDDPMLTARPTGEASTARPTGEASTARPTGECGPSGASSRQPLRVVLDGRARLPLTSKLVHSARDAPVLVVVGEEAAPARVVALERAGCEVWQASVSGRARRLEALLDEFGRRQLTSVLVEGGAEVLKTLLTAGLADEIWMFVAPSELGGDPSVLPTLTELPALEVESMEHPGGDTLVRGRPRRPVTWPAGHE